MLKITLLTLLFAGVIFGGRNILKRWIHKHRMKRNDKFKRRAEEIYKRHFRHELTEIERWRREMEPKRERYEKHVNVICKNPAIAPAFK